MKRAVTVQAFKDAMERATYKALYGAGLVRPLNNNNNLLLTWHGNDAWTAWKIENLDGKEHVSAIINFPSLPDNGIVTKHEADIIYGMELHEIGHVLFTGQPTQDKKHLMPSSELQRDLANALEDARIEGCMVKSNCAPGALDLFRLLVTYLISQGKTTSNIWDPESPAHFAFSLAVFGRMFTYDLNVKQVEVTWDGLQAKTRDIYAKILKRLPGMQFGREGTWEVYKLVKEICPDNNEEENETEQDGNKEYETKQDENNEDANNREQINNGESKKKKKKKNRKNKQITDSIDKLPEQKLSPEINPNPICRKIRSRARADDDDTASSLQRTSKGKFEGKSKIISFIDIAKIRYGIEVRRH